MKKRIRIICLVFTLLIYFALQVLWIGYRQALPEFDSKAVYQLAVNMYNNKWDIIKESQYLELYPQQLSLASTYFIIFKICNTTNSIVLQYLNAIANCFTVLALVLITNQLAKKQKANITKSILMILSFVTLPLLATFVYGDFISTTMCMFAIYFIMKYTLENKKRYVFISALFMALGYIFRMNSLIFIIAICLYMLLDILSLENKTVKSVTIKILFIIAFVITSILPANIIINSLENSLEYDKNEKFPTEGFLYIGMEEGSRANGWYNDTGSYAWKEATESKSIYKGLIKERIRYFMDNPRYCLKFYILKVESQWAENTYAALWYNQSFNIGKYDNYPRNQEKLIKVDQEVVNQTDTLIIFQKAVILIIFGSTVVVLVKYRKNMSNEILLLVIAFIGGFIFHIIWEAKSRYIIPYIIVLIPITSISLTGYWSEVKEKARIIKKKLNIRKSNNS